MTQLRDWAIAGVFIATLMAGITGFITTGLSQYGVTDNVDTGQLEQLEKIENSTSIAQEAQRRAEQAEARSDFFTLPNIINLFRLPFESVPLIEQFAGVVIQVTGLHYAPGQWPLILVGSIVVIVVAFRFGGRIV